MDEKSVIELGINAVWVAMKIAAPALIATLVVGLIVSIFQAATQINEQTLSFIPKILAMTVALVIWGSWIMQVITGFTITLLKSIPGIAN